MTDPKTTSPSMSRRHFLKVAGASAAAGAFACAGLTFVATRSPKINILQAQCQGTEPMSKKILVTYATKCGSTAEVAAAISESLCARGLTAEVRPVKTVASLAGYDAVILGSAIRYGGWLPEMMDFIKKNQAAFANLPTAIFTMHMLHAGEDAESQKLRGAYTAGVHALLTPTAEVFFTGKMDLSKLSIFDRLISAMIKAKDEDLRDWDKIRAWGQTVLA